MMKDKYRYKRLSFKYPRKYPERIIFFSTGLTKKIDTIINFDILEWNNTNKFVLKCVTIKNEF